MRYQIRLLDLTLRGLTREMALACWHAVDGLVPFRVGTALYRSLHRAIGGVLQQRVTAFRYCGSCRGCERSIPAKVLETMPDHEAFPGERIHVYLAGPESPPDVLVREAVQRTVRAVAREFPKRLLKGLAGVLQAAIKKTLEGRIFASPACGDLTICHANEAYDPWDSAEPLNRLPRPVQKA